MISSLLVNVLFLLFSKKIKSYILCSFSFSFRPSQSPSDDLGCFFRIEKIALTQQQRKSGYLSNTRARTCMQLLCNRAKTRTRSFEATGFGICEEEEEEEEATCMLFNEDGPFL